MYGARDPIIYPNCGIVRLPSVEASEGDRRAIRSHRSASS